MKRLAALVIAASALSCRDPKLGGHEPARVACVDVRTVGDSVPTRYHNAVADDKGTLYVSDATDGSPVATYAKGAWASYGPCTATVYRDGR